MHSTTEASAQEAMRLSALADPSSSYYKGIKRLLRDAELAEKRQRDNEPAVVIPVAIPEKYVVYLENKFSISIKCRGNAMRVPLSPLLTGLMFCLEDALIEHVGGSGRNVCVVDGDIMSAVALGLDCRCVERTYATPRLAVGYELEDEAVRNVSVMGDKKVHRNATVIKREFENGGGDHLWNSVRADGPRVDFILINHFKTPVGISQVAWLAECRGAYVLGSFPFQTDFFFSDEGESHCFPGKYYIDRVADVITIVPADDATMSISHPFSSLMEFVENNSVTVGGVEYLCEKYHCVKGIMYYSLKRVGSEFEAPEVLRSSFFSSESVGMTRLKFPRIKRSAEGVPIGYERAEALIFTERYEKLMGRLATNTKAVVSPADVFVALMDYNNMVVNTLDTAKLAVRMEYSDENDVALAVALQVNWQRHLAKGTFNSLLDAIRVRHAAADMSVVGFATLALSVWWTSPNVGNTMDDGDLPVSEVLDWRGNDFSVIADSVDPWHDVVQTVGLARERGGRQFPWFPQVPMSSSSGWVEAVVGVAKRFMASRRPQVVRARVGRGGIRVPAPFLATPVLRAVAVERGEVEVDTDVPQFTVVKSELRKKMEREQGAVNERVPPQFLDRFLGARVSSIGVVPVVVVDPESSIRGDLDEILGGLPERDVVTTGFRLAETEVDKVTEGVISINDSKRIIPKGVQVRRPKVDVMVEGSRVMSQAALLGAVFKRNIGVPANRGVLELDRHAEIMIDRMIDVCFRSNWQEIVEKHLNTGLWEPNIADIDVFVGDLDEKKVATLLDEFFLEGIVNLESWNLMAKGKVKPSRESGSEAKVDHPQTILFLPNSSTNAMFSAMTKRVKLVIDECLRPEVSLNAQRSDAESEEWYNSLEPKRKSYPCTYSYSTDIRCYDRAQEHSTLRPEMAFYRRLGLSRERYELWKETHGSKRAASMVYGVMAVLNMMGVSGLWKTLLRNGIINLMSVVVSTGLKREDVVMIDIVGDDMDAEFARMVDIEKAVENMSMRMNLSAKFFSADVRYMCKKFRIFLHGRWYFVADPWAMVQSALSPVRVGGHGDVLKERWVSLCSSLRHYDNGIIVDAVAEAAAGFYSMPIVPYGLARSLSRFLDSYGSYVQMFDSPCYID